MRKTNWADPVVTERAPDGFPPGALRCCLCHVLLPCAIVSQQSSEQFRVLRADHHLEFTYHPLQMVRGQRVLILSPIGVHLFRFRFLTGLICRGASPPPDDSAGIPPFRCLVPALCTVRDRPRPGVHGANAALRVQTRARRGRTMYEWTITVRDGRPPRAPGALKTPQNARTVPTPHTTMDWAPSARLRRSWRVLARSAIVPSRSRAYREAPMSSAWGTFIASWPSWHHGFRPGRGYGSGHAGFPGGGWRRPGIGAGQRVVRRPSRTRSRRPGGSRA